MVCFATATDESITSAITLISPGTEGEFFKVLAVRAIPNVEQSNALSNSGDGQSLNDGQIELMVNCLYFWLYLIKNLFKYLFIFN
ncbi:unnamed protein product [Meloidogyne enterolobii]|uniref:Uncharacterized protein n=1 Tax=Meloidogyne enterolobii TaxID=390850 RepID=A0ACB1AMU1_MELEN